MAITGKKGSAMTNTTVMLQWLDEHIEDFQEDDFEILRDIRNVVFTEAQRKEAERREIEALSKA